MSWQKSTYFQLSSVLQKLQLLHTQSTIRAVMDAKNLPLRVRDVLLRKNAVLSDFVKSSIFSGERPFKLFCWEKARGKIKTWTVSRTGQDRGSNPAKLLTLGPGALDPHFAVRQKVKRRRCRLSRRWRTIGISTGCNFHLFFTRIQREIRDDVQRFSRRFVRFGLKEPVKNYLADFFS